MNIQSIKDIVATYSIGELKQAEADLIEARPLAIEIDGSDEGEQLTHILAGMWVIEYMEENRVTLMHAMREYSKRVRDSIK